MSPENDPSPKITQADRDTQQQQIYEGVTALVKKVDALEMREKQRNEKLLDPLDEIMPTLKAMAEAWTSAAWFGKAVKWFAGIVAAFAIIFAAVRLGLSGKHGG